jgi:hypothetical protein
VAGGVDQILEDGQECVLGCGEVGVRVVGHAEFGPVGEPLRGRLGQVAGAGGGHRPGCVGPWDAALAVGQPPVGHRRVRIQQVGDQRRGLIAGRAVGPVHAPAVGGLGVHQLDGDAGRVAEGSGELAGLGAA